MAFDFPDTSGLANGYRVINPKTGTEYAWIVASQKWVLVNSGTTGDYVKKSGDVMSGPLIMSNGDLLNPAPIDITDDDQAVHKFYVDETIDEFLPDLDDDLQQPDTIDERYVNKKGGDSMQGPLTVTGGRSAGADGLEGTVKALNIDSGQNGSLQLKFNGNTRAYVGDSDFTLIPNLKFNGGNKSIYAGNAKKGFTVNDQGVFYEGNYTADKHVATKKNVEDAIDAATTDKEGHFTWDASSTVLPIGAWQFEGRSTPSYEEPGVQVINLQKVDNDGQSFDTTDFVVGGQIEISNQTNSDHLVGSITNVVDGGPESIQITFIRIRAQGQATGDQIIKTIVDISAPYVKIAGDTMVGDLTMQDAKIQFDTDDLNTKYIDFKRPNGEYITAINFSNNNDVASQEGGYEVHLSGFTSYNRLRLTGRNSTSDPNMFEARADGVMTFLKDVGFDNNRITNLGDAIQDTDAVPYGQVVAEVKDAFDKILDVGSQAEYTVWNSGSLVPGYMFPRDNSGNLKLRPSDITVIEFHKTDIAGLEADFNSLKDGDRLVIVDVDNSHVSKYRVDDPPTVSGDKYLVKIASGEGDDLELGHNVDIFFQEFQVGVDLDDYVKKAGDTMTGDLEINRTADDDHAATLLLKGKRPSTNDAVATIQFQNNTNQTIGYLTYRAYGTYGYFKINRDVEFNNKKLLNVDQIDFTSPGILKVNDENALTIRRAANGNDGNANFQISRAPNTRRTFAIRGQDTDGTERDVFYCYANRTDGDAINYFGKQTADDHIATVGKIKELISTAGDENGEIIQRHGPFHFAGIGSAVNPGQFSTDVGPLKQVRQITFNRTNLDGEDDYWSDLAPGEVFTIGQKSGPDYYIVNYTVRELQQYSTATIIDVDATQTVVSYSDGNVVYNPADAFGFISNTDTFVLESQPATLNGASVLALKASPSPAFHSFRLNSNQTVPLLGVPRGQMVFSGGATIQNPGAIVVSGYDRYGNGIQNGSNSFDCPGSILELHRRNLDGSTILCRIYQFDRLVGVASGEKITYRDLHLLYQATNGTAAVPDPGTMEAGADYLLKQQINFSASAFVIDEEGDPHFEDHPLEDVGEPVADTDAATKGYVDSQIESSLGGGSVGLDEYVKKTGDTMTGNLSIDKSANGPAAGGSTGQEAMLTLKGDRTGTTHAIGTIQFANASAPTKTGNLTYRTDTENSWFNLNAELNISNNGLKTNKLSPYSGSITTFDKKMDFTQTSDVNARFKKGFVIKKQGQSIDGTNILAAYSDFVEYNGPTNTDTRIANRKWIWDNTVRDYKTDSGWSETSGLYINAKSRGKVQNPGGSLLNKHNYEFLVSATGYGSFYVIGNDACVRNDMYVKSFAEDSNPKGNRVATVSSSRSMMGGMREAILGATDFENLKSRLLAKLEEMENSNEFSEEPTTFDIPE